MCCGSGGVEGVGEGAGLGGFLLAGGEAAEDIHC